MYLKEREEALITELLKGFLEEYGHWGMKEIPDLRVAGKILKKFKEAEKHETRKE